MSVKSITFICPECHAGQRVHMPSELPDELAFPCHECKTPRQLTRLSRSVITGCPVCGCKDLHQHKDFNKTLGLCIFLLGVIFSFYTYHLSLLIALIIDAALYPFFPWMCVCYRCEAQMRGWQKNPELDRFNHEIGAHYEYGKAKTD